MRNPNTKEEKAMLTDVYSRVTNTIVSKLEQGVRPWFQPWSGDNAAGRITRPLRASGVPYRGINVLMLWGAAVENRYAAPNWMTYKQAQELGAQVRKGERGSLVVYANTLSRTETDKESGEESEHQIPFMKGYTVFNAAQVDGLPASFMAPIEQVIDPVQRIAQAEAFFANTGADVRHGGNRAYYTAAGDYVQLPPFACFRDRESYYGTLAHELTHWTKHTTRLGREFGRKRFGDEGYAMEELVAELSAAFLSADLGLTPAPREEHASYIGTWLKALKNDTRAIFAAAAHAQRAADYLHGLQPGCAGADSETSIHASQPALVP